MTHCTPTRGDHTRCLPAHRAMHRQIASSTTKLASDTGLGMTTTPPQRPLGSWAGSHIQPPLDPQSDRGRVQSHPSKQRSDRIDPIPGPKRPRPVAPRPSVGILTDSIIPQRIWTGLDIPPNRGPTTTIHSLHRHPHIHEAWQDNLSSWPSRPSSRPVGELFLSLF